MEHDSPDVITRPELEQTSVATGNTNSDKWCFGSWFSGSAHSLPSLDQSEPKDNRLHCCDLDFPDLPDLLSHYNDCHNGLSPARSRILREFEGLEATLDCTDDEPVPRLRLMSDKHQDQPSQDDTIVYPAHLRGESLIQAIRERSEVESRKSLDATIEYEDTAEFNSDMHFQSRCTVPRTYESSSQESLQPSTQPGHIDAPHWQTPGSSTLTSLYSDLISIQSASMAATPSQISEKGIVFSFHPTKLSNPSLQVWCNSATTREEMAISAQNLQQLSIAHIQSTNALERDIDKDWMMDEDEADLTSLMEPTENIVNMDISTPPPYDLQWCNPNNDRIQKLASHRKLIRLLLLRACFLENLIQNDDYWHDWEHSVPQLFPDLPHFENHKYRFEWNTIRTSENDTIDPRLFLSPTIFLDLGQPLEGVELPRHESPETDIYLDHHESSVSYMECNSEGAAPLSSISFPSQNTPYFSIYPPVPIVPNQVEYEDNTYHLPYPIVASHMRYKDNADCPSVPIVPSQMEDEDMMDDIDLDPLAIHDDDPEDEDYYDYDSTIFDGN